MEYKKGLKKKIIISMKGEGEEDEYAMMNIRGGRSEG